MFLRRAESGEFKSIRDFYWEVIDLMQDRTDTVGWKKGIYPADDFLSQSIINGNLYVMERDGGYAASVIVNSEWNDGYEGLPWSVECTREEILVPHALAVYPGLQRQGLGKSVVEDIIEMAKEQGKKTIRLDILKGNTAAERLYTDKGFRYVQTNVMYYEDTGWTEFMMYEFIL